MAAATTVAASPSRSPRPAEPGGATGPVGATDRCRDAATRLRTVVTERASSAPPSWAALRLSTVWHELRQVLEVGLDEAAGPAAVSVVDAGGGSGGLAVPLAGLGHSVVVVDPSPDALASLERRAAESGVAERVSGQQGDLSSLADVVAPGSADVLLCHAVLEVVDDPADGLAAGLDVVRPG